MEVLRGKAAVNMVFSAIAAGVKFTGTLRGHHDLWFKPRNVDPQRQNTLVALAEEQVYYNVSAEETVVGYEEVKATIHIG